MFTVNVKNTGTFDGSETMQLYIGYENSAAERPERELKDFSRVYLKAGEAKEVKLTVNKAELAYYGNDGFVEEDITYFAYIGNCEKDSRNNKISFCFGG